MIIEKEKLESLETLDSYGYSSNFITLVKKRGFIGVFIKMGYCCKKVYLIHEELFDPIFVASYSGWVTDKYIRPEFELMEDIKNIKR